MEMSIADIFVNQRGMYQGPRDSFTDASRTVEGTGAGVYGQSVKRRLSIPLGKHATVFQAEVYAILACVHETETQDRPEKYISICSDSQAALKALRAAKSLLWCDSASRH